VVCKTIWLEVVEAELPESVEATKLGFFLVYERKHQLRKMMQMKNPVMLKKMAPKDRQPHIDAVTLFLWWRREMAVNFAVGESVTSMQIPGDHYV
jgi:hypothetical protein